ncbi:hypothetical protein EB151_00160 [archaeon]|nr:hypothetical protein [archaeon]
MQTFGSYLTEDKGGKNLHLEHIEDEIVNYGISGGRASINFLRSLRNMLAGSATKSVNMTVKWDGAPAIFAGEDPSDGKFFVAKKSVFNATPLLYKSIEEISDDQKLSDTLKSKFTIAFTEFKKLGIKGVLQGDLMFTDDVSTKTIDGESYYTFQPNTLVYAVPTNTDLGKKINSAKVGVVWHTTYTGSDLQMMSASFGVNISGLRKPSTVWMDDATYKDVSGNAKMTKSETDLVTKELSKAGSSFRKIKSDELSKFQKMQTEVMKGGLSGASFKTYLNSFIKNGEKFSLDKVKKLDYAMYVKRYFDEKVIIKLKTEKARAEKEELRDSIVKELLSMNKTVYSVIEFMGYIVEAKSLIVNKLNKIQQLAKVFIRTDNGYKVTNVEGYVAIDTDGKTAVKLVDRLEFSYNNFTAAKNWDK